VEFQEASAEALPLADAAFDRYAANFVLCVSRL
jgi:ubiquinone/menaquinone biosynthesis C-methylase UbiE